MLTDEQYKELGLALCETRQTPREVKSTAKKLFGKRVVLIEEDFDQLQKHGFVKCVECSTWTDCVAPGYSETCEDCVADMLFEDREGKE